MAEKKKKKSATKRFMSVMSKAVNKKGFGRKARRKAYYGK